MNNRSKFLLVLFVMLIQATRLVAHPFSYVVSFGDSLSDTGNNPATGDYWHGRYSNGPLWDEYFSTNSGAVLVDAAYSGSETSDLARQLSVSQYATFDGTNTIFTIWSGANDFIDSAEANGTSLLAWNNTINTAIENISNSIVTLGAVKPAYIVVVNMPDLSQLPAVKTNPLFSKYGSTLQEIVSTFNTDLATVVSGLNGNASMRIQLVNSYAALDAIVNDAAAYGFTVIDNDALDALGDPSFNGAGADYLFWDLIHPTTKAHELIALAAEAAVGKFPPLILSSPSSMVVAVGGSATLSSEAIDATSYQWYLNKRKIAHATNASYSIAKANTASGGTYYVEAISTNGTAMSANAVLTVQTAPKITAEPKSETIVQGRTAAFTVHATGTSLQYQWAFNGTNIPGATKASLAMTKVQSNSAGAYTVWVGNGVGSSTSTDAELNVLVPPQIVTQPVGSQVEATGTAEFSVAVTGTAPFHYQWEHNGVSLRGQTNATCALSGVTSKSSGKYRVLVRNAAGSVISTNAVLTVYSESAGNGGPPVGIGTVSTTVTVNPFGASPGEPPAGGAFWP